MTRLFTAIDIPSEIKVQLAQLQRPALSAVKWVCPQQMHLTLHFIGHADDRQSVRIQEALRHISSPSFHMQLRGSGRFPPKGQPKVIWMGVDNQRDVIQLYERIAATLTQEGLELAPRPFEPHVTLARVKGPVSEEWVRHLQNAQNRLQPESFVVANFTLYNSQLTPDGAHYSCVETYPLGR